MRRADSEDATTISQHPPGGARKRIGLVTAWASRINGGVFEAVVAHAKLVADLGHEPVVFGLADEHSDTDRERFGAIEVQTFPVTGPRIAGYAPRMLPALLEARLDLVHLHGIWTWPSRAGSRWAARTRRPYVISPHGMLDPWILGRGRLKKRIGRLLFEDASWRQATRFHALTEQEAADIAAATGRRESVVIPNPVPPATAQRAPGQVTVLYLGRIHPKKNIAALVDGWALARDAVAARDAALLIAGWGADEDVRALQDKLDVLGDASIKFVGPAYGEFKASLLADARFLCLPSHSEGLPVAILEAWAAGTPTLMSQHCHLPTGYARGAALDSGTTPESIAAALRHGLEMPEREWRAMADAAVGLARDTFSPQCVAEAWRATYAELMGS